MSEDNSGKYGYSLWRVARMINEEEMGNTYRISACHFPFDIVGLNIEMHYS